MNKDEIIKKTHKTKECLIGIFYKLVFYIKKIYSDIKTKINKYTMIINSKSSDICIKLKKETKKAIVIALCILVIITLIFSLKSQDSEKDIKIEAKQEIIEPINEPIVEEIIDEKSTIEEKSIIEEEIIIEEEPIVETKEHKDIDKVVLNFTATTQKPILFDIYYTDKREVWFDGSHYITHQGKKGRNNYSIVLPEDTIYRIRLDFGENPGKVTIKNIYISGSQYFDLNDFSVYEFNQFEKIKYNKDKSITFISTGNDPYMAYRHSLKD